jgi:hypothetical protein
MSDERRDQKCRKYHAFRGRNDYASRSITLIASTGKDLLLLYKT